MAKDSKYFYLKDDILKIQAKTNMYINEYGEEGTFHLGREIVQNDVDEVLDPDSPGNEFLCKYDLSTDIFTTWDNGRSFNESTYPMQIFCTTLQSGSKFFREAGTPSSGEFGIGMTTVNALSEYFRITAYRAAEKTIHMLEFNEGILVKDEKRNNPDKIHGTEIEFRVSKKYMGKDAKMPIEKMVQWIESLFYLNADALRQKKVTGRVEIYDGLELKNVYKFKPKEFSGIVDKMLISPTMNKKDLTNIVYLSGKTHFLEDSKILKENKNGTTSVATEKTEKEITMDIAFQYYTSPEVSEQAQYITFCNYTNTKDNGVHLEAFEEAYCRYMQKKVNDSLSDAQKEKMKVTWDDIRTNLLCVISLSTNAYVGFVGNAKEKIGNRELIPYMKDIISEELEKFFSKNQTLLNTLVKFIKVSIKARLEATKAKMATQMEKLNTFKEFELTNYIRCNHTGKQWKELCSRMALLGCEL